MDESLREKLIGAWRLVDVVKESVDGSPPEMSGGKLITTRLRWVRA
jgi:hypothetical protein